MRTLAEWNPAGCPHQLRDTAAAVSVDAASRLQQAADAADRAFVQENLEAELEAESAASAAAESARIAALETERAASAAAESVVSVSTAAAELPAVVNYEPELSGSAAPEPLRSPSAASEDLEDSPGSLAADPDVLADQLLKYLEQRRRTGNNGTAHEGIFAIHAYAWEEVMLLQKDNISAVMLCMNCKNLRPMRGNKGVENVLVQVNDRYNTELYGPASPASAGYVSLTVDASIIKESWRRVYRTERQRIRNDKRRDSQTPGDDDDAANDVAYSAVDDVLQAAANDTFVDDDEDVNRKVKKRPASIDNPSAAADQSLWPMDLAMHLGLPINEAACLAQDQPIASICRAQGSSSSSIWRIATGDEQAVALTPAGCPHQLRDTAAAVSVDDSQLPEFQDPAAAASLDDLDDNSSVMSTCSCSCSSSSSSNDNIASALNTAAINPELQLQMRTAAKELARAKAKGKGKSKAKAKVKCTAALERDKSAAYLAAANAENACKAKSKAKAKVKCTAALGAYSAAAEAAKANGKCTAGEDEAKRAAAAAVSVKRKKGFSTAWNDECAAVFNSDFGSHLSRKDRFKACCQQASKLRALGTPSDLQYGCSKCRKQKSGCQSCNPDKKHVAEAKKLRQSAADATAAALAVARAAALAVQVAKAKAKALKDAALAKELKAAALAKALKDAAQG
jgi:hypothetical protein